MRLKCGGQYINTVRFFFTFEFMKFIIIYILFAGWSLSAQIKQESVIISINDIDYDSGKIYFNPKNVKDFHKEKLAEDTLYTSHRYKKILLEQKKKSPIVSISSMISDVRNNNKIPNNEAISVTVDGELLINPEEYYIEESFIKELTIVTSPPEEKNDHNYHGTSIFIKSKKDLN